MLNQLKSFLKRIPPLVKLVRAARKARQDLSDICETYVPRSLRPVRVVRCYGLTLQAGSAAAHRSMQSGVFEAEEIEVFKSHLATAQVVVDVGANIGLYSCLARLAGRHTIAVEPQSKNLELLYRNLLASGCSEVEVYPVGLNEHAGLGVLYGVSGTGASLVEGWAVRSHSQWIRTTIPLTTLDILLGERFRGRKLLIKIDVEGAEYATLSGATQTLGMLPRPTWIVEITQNEYYPGGFNPNYAATFELFWRHGYEARTADRHHRLVEPADVQRWVREKFSDSGAINYVFSSTS